MVATEFSRRLASVPRGVCRALCLLACLLLALSSLHGQSAVLPEDRADLLLHQYQGDGSTFNGPSILVRKQYKDKVSVWGNYYIDMNSTASVDVVTQGSPFEEERVQTSVGADYLHGKTMISAAFTNSSENDYEADNYSFGISQDFFGDLSTLSLTYSKGDDEIYQNQRVNTSKSGIVGRNLQGLAEHQRFGIAWTQVMTKNWIVALKAEAVIDEGFLKNPYRSFRLSNGSLIEDSYPTTRNSDAYALNSMYYLPWRGAFKFEYRGFADSWDIRASNVELKYVHPFREEWIFEFRLRHYDQTKAYFYFDTLDFEAFEFYGRDKELSTFTSDTIGLGVTYELKENWLSWIDKTTLNFYIDHVMYDYEDFRDARESDGDNPIATTGNESLFSFDAQAIRFFISFWY